MFIIVEWIQNYLTRWAPRCFSQNMANLTAIRPNSKSQHITMSWFLLIFIIFSRYPFLGLNNQYFLVRFKIYSVATFSRCYKFANMIISFFLINICLNWQNCISVNEWKTLGVEDKVWRANFGFHGAQRVKSSKVYVL